jgi:hypothetical protein
MSKKNKNHIQIKPRLGPKQIVNQLVGVSIYINIIKIDKYTYNYNYKYKNAKRYQICIRNLFAVKDLVCNYLDHELDCVDVMKYDGITKIISRLKFWDLEYITQMANNVWNLLETFYLELNGLKLEHKMYTNVYNIDAYVIRSQKIDNIFYVKLYGFNLTNTYDLANYITYYLNENVYMISSDIQLLISRVPNGWNKHSAFMMVKEIWILMSLFYGLYLTEE